MKNKLLKRKKELIRILGEHEARDNFDIVAFKGLEKDFKFAQKMYKLQNGLGCPLEVAFKALNNGIYTSESELEPKYEMFEVRGIEKNGLSVISKMCGYAECDFLCEYKDYKKTWWLKADRSE